MIDELIRYLNFEWADEDFRADLERMVTRGTDYLEWIAGEKLDFKKDNLAKSLLFDYVRYSVAQALDEFSTDYENLLLTLAIQHNKGYGKGYGKPVMTQPVEKVRRIRRRRYCDKA